MEFLTIIIVILICFTILFVRRDGNYWERQGCGPTKRGCLDLFFIMKREKVWDDIWICRSHAGGNPVFSPAIDAYGGRRWWIPVFTVLT